MYHLVKVPSCQNNPEKSYTQKEASHEPSGWAMFKRCSFNKKENKLNYYRGKDCIEISCKKILKSAMEIIDYEKKEIIPLTHEENNFYNEQEILITKKYHKFLDKSIYFWLAFESYCFHGHT